MCLRMRPRGPATSTYCQPCESLRWKGRVEKVKVAALRQAVLEAATLEDATLENAMLQHAPETLKRARELQDQFDSEPVLDRFTVRALCPTLSGSALAPAECPCICQAHAICSCVICDLFFPPQTALIRRCWVPAVR